MKLEASHSVAATKTATDRFALQILDGTITESLGRHRGLIRRIDDGAEQTVEL